MNPAKNHNNSLAFRLAVMFAVSAALLLTAWPAQAGDAADPRQRVGRTNAEARVQPDPQGYRNAIQQYP